MKSNYKRLGEYIRAVDYRNSENITNRVLGISIDKYFMPSVANVIGTDLGKYKLLKKGFFACNPMHVGRDERLPVALYDENTPAIISPAYFMFEVRDSRILDPEYLMLWFRRAEFDRQCWFRTDASVRGGITWEALCEVGVNVPPLERQLEIVKTYKTIEERIKLKQRVNGNLEATAQSYFDELFISGVEPDCTLADIALVNPTRPLAKGKKARCFEMATLPTSGCIPVGDVIKPYNGGVRFVNGDTLIARITPCLENGKAAYVNILSDGEVAFGSTEYIVFAAKDDMPSCFYYFLIRNSKFVSFALQFMNGSSGRQRVSGEELASFPMLRPSSEKLEAFSRVGNHVLEHMKENTIEIQKLKRFQDMIATTISSHQFNI